MTGTCQLCGVAGAELDSHYKQKPVGGLLCFCCRVKAFNLSAKARLPDEHADIGLRFARMMHQRPRRAAVAVPERSPYAPADWCAHSLPPSDL